jgi:hypothetical protein
MAAQGEIRDKILRVSMPFEKWSDSKRRLSAALKQKHPLFGNTTDPWSVVLKVRSWATQLSERKVHSCAEIARREGITRARVSQLWPLCEITREQATFGVGARKGKAMSLRRLIQIARNPD